METSAKVYTRSFTAVIESYGLAQALRVKQAYK